MSPFYLTPKYVTLYDFEWLEWPFYFMCSLLRTATASLFVAYLVPFVYHTWCEERRSAGSGGQQQHTQTQHRLPSLHINKPTHRFAPCRLDLVNSWPYRASAGMLAHARHAFGLVGLCFPTARCGRGAVCKAVGHPDFNR